MQNEKAFIYLTEMGFTAEKANEVLNGLIGEQCKGLLSTMEDGFRNIVWDPNIEPMKVFQKVKGDINLLGSGKNKF